MFGGEGLLLLKVKLPPKVSGMGYLPFHLPCFNLFASRERVFVGVVVEQRVRLLLLTHLAALGLSLSSCLLAFPGSVWMRTLLPGLRELLGSGMGGP